MNSTDMDIRELNAQHFARTCLNSLAGSSMNETHIDDTCNLSADCCQHVNPSRFPSHQFFKLSTCQLLMRSIYHFFAWNIGHCSTYCCQPINSSGCQLNTVNLSAPQTVQSFLSAISSYHETCIHVGGVSPHSPVIPQLLVFRALHGFVFPGGSPPFPGDSPATLEFEGSAYI